MVAKDNSIYNKSTPSGHSILKKRKPTLLPYTIYSALGNSYEHGITTFYSFSHRSTMFCLVFAIRFAFAFAACTKHISFIPKDPFKCLCVQLKKRHTIGGCACMVEYWILDTRCWMLDVACLCIYPLHNNGVKC